MALTLKATAQAFANIGKEAEKATASIKQTADAVALAQKAHADYRKKLEDSIWEVQNYFGTVDMLLAEMEKAWNRGDAMLYNKIRDSIERYGKLIEMFDRENIFNINDYIASATGASAKPGSTTKAKSGGGTKSGKGATGKTSIFRPILPSSATTGTGEQKTTTTSAPPPADGATGRYNP